MKLVQNFTDRADANAMSSMLRKKGIMTFISSQETRGLGKIRGGSPTVGVWIVFPEQYADSISVLKNKHHKVSSPLSYNEMKGLEEEARSKFNNSSGVLLWWLLGASLILSLLVIFIFFYMSKYY